jgi:hypothetical protein
MSCLRVSALALLSAAFATALSAQEPTVPVVEEDGTIRGSISGEIKAEFTRRVRTSSPPSMTDGLDVVRQRSDDMSQAQLEAWLKIYPASIDEKIINGVRTYIVTPTAGIAPGNENRVMINAHMGGFRHGRCGPHTPPSEKQSAPEGRYGSSRGLPSARDDGAAALRGLQNVTYSR